MERNQSDGVMFTPTAHDWMLRYWRPERTRLLRAIGKWVAYSRARLPEDKRSFHNLQIAARAQGEDLSENLLFRLEKLRDLSDEAVISRKKISITALMWLAAYSGQTLADLATFLLDDLAANADASANVTPALASQVADLGALYASLSNQRQMALLDYASHLYALDQAQAAADAETRRHTKRLRAKSPATHTTDETASADNGAAAAQAKLRQARQDALSPEAHQERIEQIEQQNGQNVQRNTRRKAAE